MHGSSDWLPPGYKNWDAVLTEAVRKGMEKHPRTPCRAARPEPMGLWKLARDRHRTSAVRRFCPWLAASPEPARSRSAATPPR